MTSLWGVQQERIPRERIVVVYICIYIYVYIYVAGSQACNTYIDGTCDNVKIIFLYKSL